jgi:hypothetical protein
MINIMMISDNYSKITSINKTEKDMLAMQVILFSTMNGGSLQLG